MKTHHVYLSCGHHKTIVRLPGTAFFSPIPKVGNRHFCRKCKTRHQVVSVSTDK